MNLLIKLILLFTFFTFSISAQYNFENLKQRMRQFVDENELVGYQTIVFKNGEVVHYDNYGFSDFEQGKPLQDNSIFRIASITKCIVAVGIMKLYEKHQNMEKAITEYTS